MLAAQDACLISIDTAPSEDAMVEIIEILRQEHRNIEKLLRVMEETLRRDILELEEAAVARRS